MSHFFARVCKVNKIRYPGYAKRWINIRKVFSNHYKIQQVCLSQMLTHLGLEFEGRKHSGYDDTHNISRVLIRMLLDGANPIINERISWHSAERVKWGDMTSGYIRCFYDKKSNRAADTNPSDSDDTETEEILDRIIICQDDALTEQELA